MSTMKRTEYYDRAKLATAMAIEAKRKMDAWEVSLAALRTLVKEYPEGNIVHSMVEKWVSVAAFEAGMRIPKLRELQENNLKEASRYMDLFDNESGL